MLSSGYWRTVFLRFPNGLAAADEDELRRMAESMRGRVAGLRDVAFGVDEGGRGQGFTHGLMLVFESREAHVAYLPHPDHVAIGAFLRALGCEVAFLTFEAALQKP